MEFYRTDLLEKEFNFRYNIVSHLYNSQHLFVKEQVQNNEKHLSCAKKLFILINMAFYEQRNNHTIQLEIILKSLSLHLLNLYQYSNQ